MIIDLKGSHAFNLYLNTSWTWIHRIMWLHIRQTEFEISSIEIRFSVMKYATHCPCLTSIHTATIQSYKDAEYCKLFIISFCSCGCHNTPRVMWLQLKHLVTGLQLQFCKWSAVTWLPLATFTVGFWQTKSMVKSAGTCKWWSCDQKTLQLHGIHLMMASGTARTVVISHHGHVMLHLMITLLSEGVYGTNYC